MSRQKYSNEFKGYVIRLVLDDGRKVKDLTRELNIPYDTLSKWVAREKHHREDQEKARQRDLLTATELQKQLEAEQKRNADLEEELDIVKKAMHIFNQNRT